MSREEMHAVLDAAINVNDCNEEFEITAEFSKSATGEEMIVHISVWDSKKLRNKEEGRLVTMSFYYDAESAIKAIMAYKEAEA